MSTDANAPEPGQAGPVSVPAAPGCRGPGHAARVARRWRPGGSSATIEAPWLPEPPVPVVRRATDGDVDAMAAQLAATFFDDPVSFAHLPQRGARDGGPTGVLPYPDAGRLPSLRGLLHDRRLRRLGHLGPRRQAAPHGTRGASSPCCPCCRSWPRTCITTLRLLNLVEAMHPHEPHWYLASLGTAVGRQGTGVGSALMRPVLEHCDAEGMPCYLESSKERNVPFYRRHGFEVVQEAPLPGDGPPIWTMWREPRPVSETPVS